VRATRGLAYTLGRQAMESALGARNLGMSGRQVKHFNSTPDVARN